MAPATELAFLPLKAGTDIETEGSPGFKLHNELAQTVLSQPGCQRLYWSREVENPENLRWFLDWDSIEDHHNFEKSEAYKPFLEKFGTLLGGAPNLWHAHFEPFPPSAALDISTSGATEVLHAFFPTDISEDDAKEVEKRLTKVMDIIGGAGGTAYAGGWVEEELDIPGKGEKGKAFAGLVGWKSVEAHKAFRETQTFKDNIGLLREAKDLKGTSVVHVNGKLIEKAK